VIVATAAAWPRGFWSTRWLLWEPGRAALEESEQLESVAARQAAMTTPIASSSSRPDYCGSTGSEFVPEGAFGVDWSDACQTHDQCYATPGAEKDLCDYGLQEDMSLACAAQNGGLLCYIAAGVYYTGVQVMGSEAFERAQKGGAK
jgi:hypothetical protein